MTIRAQDLIAFADGGLDRAAHLRPDTAALARLRSRADAATLVFWRGKVLAKGEDLLVLPFSHPLLETGWREAPLFLGLTEQGPRFAVDLDFDPREILEPTAPGSLFDPAEQHHPLLTDASERFVEMRALAATLTPLEGELAATAKALLGWHATHAYCARCGERSAPNKAGWQRDCPSCQAQHFPRTDMVVIMLITKGDQLLLGRNENWPEGMYSLLAGFMEPGETVEAAVRREVLEETGVRVGEVSYVASQPWPFPSSLMVGCTGEALSEAITIDRNELQDALWVSRSELDEILEGRHKRIQPPRKGAIAGWLIRRFAAQNPSQGG